MINPYLFIATTANKGRGVFTKNRIPAHTIIEVAPVIVMAHTDKEQLNKTLLHDYIFDWGANELQCCMALGYVPIYNHSYASNCEYEMDYNTQTISITTVTAIAANRELTINYNGNWNDATLVWFDVQ